MSHSTSSPQAYALLIALTTMLTACAEQKTSTTVFERPTSECAAEAIPTRYIVRFTDGQSTAVRAASDDDFLNHYVTPNLEKIDYAEPDYAVHAYDGVSNTSASADDPDTIAIDNWGVARVGADAMWAAGTRGEGVIVAVIDTGMDFKHPRLKNQVHANPGETGLDSLGRDKATNGIDDDGNGFVDDALGYDFSRNAALRGDNAEHGTHVSGIIASEHSDLVAGPTDHVQGVAPGAKILPLAFLNEKGSGLMSDAVTAIKYAVDQGARVINASWGGPVCSRTLRDEIGRLETKGVFFVAAAGNSGQDVDDAPEYPAALNLAAQITVGATGELNSMADFSNYGSKTVHIFAPGSNIVSTLPGGRVGELSGTSMAAPFISGSIALLMSAYPNATLAEIRQSLYNTAVHRTDYLNVSQGRVNLQHALTELRSILRQ